MSDATSSLMRTRRVGLSTRTMQFVLYALVLKQGSISRYTLSRGKAKLFPQRCFVRCQVRQHGQERLHALGVHG